MLARSLAVGNGFVGLFLFASVEGETVQYFAVALGRHGPTMIGKCLWNEPTEQAVDEVSRLHQ